MYYGIDKQNPSVIGKTENFDAILFRINTERWIFIRMLGNGSLNLKPVTEIVTAEADGDVATKTNRPNFTATNKCYAYYASQMWDIFAWIEHIRSVSVATLKH